MARRFGIRMLMAAFLVVVLLAWTALPVQSQEISPGPDSDRVSPSNREDQRDVPESVQEQDYPIWGPEEEDLAGRVIQAFPQNGAIFQEDFVITLGWQGLSADFAQVQKYIVIISNDSGFFKRVDTGPWRPNKPTYILFSPPGPGRYLWRVDAPLDQGGFTGSNARYFTVLSRVQP